MLSTDRFPIDLPEASGNGTLSVSALTGEGIEELVDIIRTKRREALAWCTLKINICTGDLEYWIRTNSIVDSFVRNENTGAVEVVCGLYRGLNHLKKRLSREHPGWRVVPISAQGQVERGTS